MALIQILKDPFDKTPIPVGYIRRFINQFKYHYFRERHLSIFPE